MKAQNYTVIRLKVQILHSVCNNHLMCHHISFIYSTLIVFVFCISFKPVVYPKYPKQPNPLLRSSFKMPQFLFLLKR